MFVWLCLSKELMVNHCSLLSARLKLVSGWICQQQDHRRGVVGTGIASRHTEDADLELVKKFTQPNFQVK